MMNTNVEIIVAILSILGIATKEFKQGRISKQFCTSMSPLIERCLEKHVKKWIGRTDLEESLNRLDNLTHEQAQMASAKVQRATDAIDETRQRGKSRNRSFP
jgi:hypothetical protein